ncbi:MAG: hypothetical protein ACR2G2_12885 [Pseudonocardia sp.]
MAAAGDRRLRGPGGYFVLAVGAHLWARDIGRNLLSAIGLLAAYVAALVFVLRAAGHG